MTDRPIIFSAPMVRALLDGRKTQTRRLAASPLRHCQPGDRLYVREAFTLVPSSAYRMSEGVEQVLNPTDPDVAAIFTVGWERSIPKWRPSIHMPRWASRLTLIVEAVRFQRLSAITDADALAEGIESEPDRYGRTRYFVKGEGFNLGSTTPSHAYIQLWSHLHDWNAPANAGINRNPDVVALTFRVIHQNIDQVPA